MSNIKLVKDQLTDMLNSGADPAKVVEVMQQYEKAAGLSSKRKYLPPSVDELRQRYATNQELRKRAVAAQIPFIDAGVGQDFKLTQGLILVGAVSGYGKSTNCANLLNGFLEAEPRKKALVITNEENSAAVYSRTACVRLGLDFKDYYNERLHSTLMRQVDEVADELAERVVVEDGSEAYDMTVLEDVQAALCHAAEGEYGITLMDYFQTVTTSSEDPDMDPVRVSKKLGFFMKDYGRKVQIPVVMFVQLRDSDEMHFKDRVENDRTVYNHAFMVVEVIPDFENKTSKFRFHKDRFGDSQGQDIVMRYQGGKFIPEGCL